MTPCEVEVRAPASEKWIKAVQVGPEDRPGSFSNIREDKVREIVLFECSKDDSETKIFRSDLGVDWEAGDLRGVLADQELLELVKTLKKGESYEMNITTDRGTKAVVRFTHK